MLTQRRSCYPLISTTSLTFNRNHTILVGHHWNRNTLRELAQIAFTKALKSVGLQLTVKLQHALSSRKPFYKEIRGTEPRLTDVPFPLSHQKSLSFWSWFTSLYWNHRTVVQSLTTLQPILGLLNSTSKRQWIDEIRHKLATHPHQITSIFAQCKTEGSDNGRVMSIIYTIIPKRREKRTMHSRWLLLWRTATPVRTHFWWVWLNTNASHCWTHRKHKLRPSQFHYLPLVQPSQAFL